MARELKKMTMDGNTAAAYTSYAFTENAAIYPITPSSPMADYTDQWAQQGRKNIFGQTVNIVEMESEGGAAGAVHGSLATGALTTTYTASQGLLLMIPNMYKISGELLPCVFHVSARALAAHALSIFGDHADVMACRQTGFAMLCSNSVQEVADLAAVAHLTAIKTRVPFLHFFDGFRTSHEIQKIEVIDYDDLAELVDYDVVAEFRKRALSPNHPTLRGTAQNPDVYFQAREAANPFYNSVPDAVQAYMDKINEIRGTDYKLYNYYGAADAERVIIAMGSVDETIDETIDYLVSRGEKVGLVKVHLYRPFVASKFLEAIPSTVKAIAVLDRTKEPGSLGEPLYLDVCAAYAGKNAPVIIGGRYGLGSKDTTPDQILAVYKELKKDEPKKFFTIGINDDVTNLSLDASESIDVANEGTVQARFWGLGADGTVGANKNSIKIIGDHTDMYAQAYFSYDSKKSGGVTISDLRFGKTPIRSTYLVNKADFVACHNQSYVTKYDMLSTLKPGGTFLLNTQWSVEELEENLPGEMKRYIANNNIKFYILDAVAKAKEIGLGGRINTICQSAFFKLSNIIPVDDAVDYMKKAALKSYGKKGDDIVQMNYKAIEAGVDAVVPVTVPDSWKTAPDAAPEARNVPEFVAKIVDVMNAQKGDTLPVSAFVGREDGTFPQGTAQYEKRGIAVDIPVWNADECLECNQCSLVCPHAAIRPFLLTEEEAAGASFATKQGMKPYDSLKYRMQVSALDCTGCGCCLTVCPKADKALAMAPLKDNMAEAANWDYCLQTAHKDNPMPKTNIKGSQFEQPLLEFSGACAGCGETAYAKLLTQLFGDRMQISNATGCSSIWGGSAPSMPYTTNYKGQGPAWGNSLFEDNAEHGLGMYLGYKQLRKRVKELVTEFTGVATGDAKAAADEWLNGFDSSENTRAASDKLAEALKAYSGEGSDIAKKALGYEDFFVKRSQWIIGGDGWAYDIGYGGLDHVLATGEDINVLVLDTEVYSNTGGQASKSTPQGAVAQFAAGGKHIKKKDLGMMAMSYGYVYVAQVALGSNSAQTLKAFTEAEAYNGPSLVICYAPCINHGIKGGMKGALNREKAAVECGYWQLFRFNPTLAAEGKNPFTLDSKEPTGDFFEFIKAEVRYNSLYKKYDAEVVDDLFSRCYQDSRDRLLSYKRKAANIEV
ncbi:MAG: pyruvate:ferredoxin (flavodoxin) oxidoreductase [Clostridiales bacterium]|nr:pyruvate:ferredoxin (flavodoxin) oxidoreductase [Clostridiales bacterium]